VIKCPLSLVVITLNEEKRLRSCIESVPFVDEIIVLDSGSTDRTSEVAKELGAIVHVQKFLGFGLQKRKAVDLAKNDWVLCLDADEVVSQELAKEIQTHFFKLSPEQAVSFPRRSFHLGRWINFGGWYPDRRVRLFNRKHHQWSEASVHEEVKVESKQHLRFTQDLQHFVFDSLQHQIATNNHYSTLQALELKKKNKRFSLWNLLTKPPVKFIELYLLKQGFRDGLPGFIIAVGGAYSTFLKWSKLWEQESQS